MLHFFENIFLMRDETSSSRQEFIEDDGSAEPIEHNEHTLVENPEEETMMLRERARDKGL